MNNLKPLSEHLKEGKGQLVSRYLTSAWYFETWYEKLILIGLGVLGLLRIWQWIF